MYMATAMYPYYNPQQGMSIPTASVQSGGMFPGYMFGFPGYPPISPLMPVWPNQMAAMDPTMRAPFTPGMPSYAPRMMPVPSPEYAGYYHKATDVQPSQQPPGMGFRGNSHAAAAAQAAPAVDSGLEKLKTDSEGESKGPGSFTWRTHSASSQSAEIYSRSLSDRERMSSARIPENKRPARRERGRRRDSATSQSAAPSHKDSLLEEFKTNKARRFEFRDILGHICEFSMDQHGSRFIQQKLDSLTGDELASVVTEVLPKSLALMQDVFGNYVVQKLLEHGTREQRSKLARAMEGQVLTLSLQMYGCRVVQKALEVCSREEGIAMARELEGQVMKCVRDQNGNHVIQKAIECVPTQHVMHIIDSFLGSVVPLCMHPFGCRVIQRVLEHCTDVQKRQVFMEDILKATLQLAQDQYGNYVVQHVLERGTGTERHEVVRLLASQIVALSQHKFASNVVEKCLEHAGPAERQLLLAEMLRTGDQEAGEEEPLQALMKDQFANYVVQKLLEVCDEEQREALLSRIRAHLHTLRKFTFGKHIVTRVEKLLATGTRMQSSARRDRGEVGAVPQEAGELMP